MMNNVVLMFSPTDEKTPYEQGENRTVILFSRARSIVHKFLKRFPAWTKPERVLMGLLLFNGFTSGFDQLTIL